VKKFDLNKNQVMQVSIIEVHCNKFGEYYQWKINNVHVWYYNTYWI